MKTLFTVIALCGAVTAFAQIEKGRSYLTGQISAGATNQSGQTPTVNNKMNSDAISLSLTYGYMVSNSWAVGLRGNVSHNQTKFATSSSTTASYGVSPYVRKYFSIAPKFYIHLDGGVQYTHSLTQSQAVTDPTRDKSTLNTTSIYITPGMSYFVTNRFAFTANIGSLNYNHKKSQGDSDYDKYTSNNLNVLFGLNTFALGVSVYL